MSLFKIPVTEDFQQNLEYLFALKVREALLRESCNEIFSSENLCIRKGAAKAKYFDNSVPKEQTWITRSISPLLWNEITKIENETYTLYL